jgi:formamidopyrimidine-DNA glycosylase
LIVSAAVLCQRISRGTAREIAAAVIGQRIQALDRHGKHLVLRLERGLLIIHLGMTGKLLLDGQQDDYTRAWLQLEDRQLIYSDTRRFGRWEYCDCLPDRLTKLGPDAATVDFESFSGALRARRTRIKTLLLNQAFLRGVGNIYADEALFLAKIHPLGIAAELSRKQAVRLHKAIIEVLAEAIAHRGSSISDYVDHLGEKGGFQLRHQVYGRTGKPCNRCGSPIERLMVGQRSSHFCPRCQRL